MATMTASPMTPNHVAIPPAAPTPPTGGTWQHPRIMEIEQRREAAMFTRTKFWNAMASVVLLVGSFLSLLTTILKLFYIPQSPSYLTWAFRLLLSLNIYRNLRPLWAPEDNMTDIPLTDKQRQLLGLPPAFMPATPGSSYSTPPRYTRSAARTGSSRAAVQGSSPLDRSTNGSPISGSPLAGRGVVSPYGLGGLGSSPATGSPLVRKAMEQRRSSSSGPLVPARVEATTSLFSDDSSGKVGSPASPTPNATGRNATVALNSKWLYQRSKGRLSTGGGTAFT